MLDLLLDLGSLPVNRCVTYHISKAETCPINANCKCSHLDRMKGDSNTVIFIGDGTTDECFSKKADMVFARDKLLEICRREGKECIPWDNWYDVLDTVKDFLYRPFSFFQTEQEQ